MDPLTIFFNANTAVGDHPSIIFPTPVMAADHTNHRKSRMAEILNDFPGQFAYALAQEARNPLGHITLSVEMLQSLIKDNDQKIYLDVIMRNSIRINDLINEFLTCQHAKRVQEAKYSVHQLVDSHA
jgi:nitrogen-specific signal transduction histidine kinase